MDHVEAHSMKVIGSVPAAKLKSSAVSFRAGDVLYGRLRPYLNKVAQPEFDGAASAEFIVFPSSEQIRASFLKYRLNASDFVSFASHLNEGDRPRVNFDQIGAFEICVPPPLEQDRIVAKIEELFFELDKGVHALKTARTQLNVYRQSILKHAFEGKLTADWREENRDKLESPEQLLVRIRQEGRSPAPHLVGSNTLAKLPPLPVGFVYASLSCLGELGRGKSKHRPRNAAELFGGPYPFIQTGEVKAADRIIRGHSKTYSERGLAQSKLWPKGTLCITIAANIAETALLGFHSCFPDSVVGFTASRKLVVPEYVELFIKSVRAQIEAYAPATAQKNINLATLENLVVPVCSLDEQRIFVDKLETVFSVLEKRREAIDNCLEAASALRQSILRSAFAGQLVPQDLEDEPASVLLDRIRTEREQSMKNRQSRKSKNRSAAA